MKDDPIYNSKFVKYVEQWRCLYDHGHEYYTDRDQQDRAWNEIAKLVGESAESCREKWRNIRRSFSRYLKRFKQGKKQKTYYLAPHLEFVLPFTKTLSKCNSENTFDEIPDSDSGNDDFLKIKKRKSATETNDLNNILSEADNCMKIEIEDEIDSDSKDGESSNFFSSNDMNKNSDGRESPRILPYYEFQKMFDVQKTPASSLNNVSNVDTTTTERDADLYFFKSLLPDVKLMTAKQKRKMRLEIMQVIDHILVNS